MCQEAGLPKSQKKLWLIISVLFMTTQWWLLHISYHNIGLVVFLAGKVTMQWAGRSVVWIPLQKRKFLLLHNVQTDSGVHPAFHSMGTWVFLGSSGWGMKLTTHLHLESTLRIRGDVPPLTICAFTTWTRTTLHLSLPLFLTNYFATNSNKSCTFSSSEIADVLRPKCRDKKRWWSFLFCRPF
jgi:hypothetical protein